MFLLCSIIPIANREDRVQKVTWYRALCLGKPVGPWRPDRNAAREDLIQRGLGSYDEWGHFWVTVPGDLKVRHEHQSIAA